MLTARGIRRFGAPHVERGERTRARDTANRRWSESGARRLDQPIGGRSGGGSLERPNAVAMRLGSSRLMSLNVIAFAVRDAGCADIVA